MEGGRREGAVIIVIWSAKGRKIECAILKVPPSISPSLQLLSWRSYHIHGSYQTRSIASLRLGPREGGREEGRERF